MTRKQWNKPWLARSSHRKTRHCLVFFIAWQVVWSSVGLNAFGFDSEILPGNICFMHEYVADIKIPDLPAESGGKGRDDRDDLQANL